MLQAKDHPSKSKTPGWLGMQQRQQDVERRLSLITQQISNLLCGFKSDIFFLRCIQYIRLMIYSQTHSWGEALGHRWVASGGEGSTSQNWKLPPPVANFCAASLHMNLKEEAAKSAKHPDCRVCRGVWWRKRRDRDLKWTILDYSD